MTVDVHTQFGSESTPDPDRRRDWPDPEALADLLALAGIVDVPPDRRGLTDRELRELAEAAWADGYR